MKSQFKLAQQVLSDMNIAQFRKVYPRKRRIWEHEANPFMETLYMKHRIKAYEVRFAKIKSGIPDVSKTLWDCPVEVLFL